MTTSTIFHVRGRDQSTIEQALTTIFAREERPLVMRLEGSYAAVHARLIDPGLAASYRYLLLRPHPHVEWTPLLELGDRADGLDLDLSRELEGAAVFSISVYGEDVLGYRLARDGTLVDRYASDPLYFAADVEADRDLVADVEAQRGHPELFPDLLPANTSPADFALVVLRPGWWEAHDRNEVTVATGELLASEDGQSEDEGDVDEVDRMRCIALALELWGPSEYPFTGDLADIPGRRVGPATALAFS